MTFSIVAFDAATGQLGCAVQSKAFAVGSRVPWLQAGVGAVATQANVNPHYGSRGLELLRAGHTPADAIAGLTQSDPGYKIRQVGIVDVQGRSATYTGENCLEHARGLAGDGWACQGNILASADVVTAMAEAYTTTQAPFAERLLAALAAGQEAGGDARGMQSAALRIAGHNPNQPDGILIDLRVDDHHSPIEELIRIYHVRQKAIEAVTGDYICYAGDIVYIADQLMQKLHIPSLQGLAEHLGVHDAISGRKISQQFRQAIDAERQK
ncbi:MAG: hypothetical protein K0R39_3140 [Symbiobacteriaceae bacterium]|jgi:uncharacterized Ntn-hydrolase superfamily protein|nr:hypothetical protein [Symbiobacteriaceae bacterium]